MRIYIYLAIIILCIGMLSGTFAVGYKLGTKRDVEVVRFVFTNITNFYTNVDFSISNSGDPFLDFYSQLK